ncbi:MAG: type II toxin-antitoxin system RelE/ParE family toxin [Chloroflexi bacterium]|nr:type II toxin-antitoxin system RelE/ParE family toxin [Chloroflexota bacterium]
MSYTIRLARPAAKALERLDQSTEGRVRTRLRELADDPFDPRLSKPLVGVEGLRSSRIGGWRVLFTVNEAERAVYVVAIRPRGEAYRRLND